MTIVLGAAVLLAWGVYQYAHTTPRFALKRLEIQGATKRGEADILRLGGFKYGDNLFRLDTAKIEQRLLSDPWIKKAKVTRELPGTIQVELAERDVAALAVIGERLYLVTRTGEPFKEFEEADQSDMPLITGVSAENLARDRTQEVARIATGMEVLRHYERIPMHKVHPAQEVHLGADGIVTLTIGKKGIALHLGRGPWRKKLLMAWRVMGRMARRGRLPGIVFLDNEAHPERVVVRMR